MSYPEPGRGFCELYDTMLSPAVDDYRSFFYCIDVSGVRVCGVRAYVRCVACVLHVRVCGVRACVCVFGVCACAWCVCVVCVRMWCV